MALQNSGAISFADLASEFGAPNSNIKMSDFKRQSGKNYQAHQDTTTYPYPIPQTSANNSISDSTSNTATRNLSDYYGGKADNNAVTTTTPNSTWNRKRIIPPVKSFCSIWGYSFLKAAIVLTR